MSRRRKRFYVVWKGHTPGVYSEWSDCTSMITGYSNPRYKAFPTRESAEKAFRDGPDAYWGTGLHVSALSAEELAAIGEPELDSLCVDSAWNAETKVIEYRGVWLRDRAIAFHQGPFERATNNIGEFLAIVHGLAFLSKRSLDCPVYSDSKVAIGWVRRKDVRSRSMSMGLTGEQVSSLVERALAWLEANDYPNALLKWETEAWGEIPADFGRK